ncbi:MAG TPA: diaminopimelate epimerase [Novosphingobium sp.]|nr:diaminopimelate epimerase [Novosphingobium sp.]
MRVSFIKMHGLGNDFVVLDARVQPLPALTGQFARALADRRSGIGCDQLIVLEPSTIADLKMRIFNPDGGEVGACGNATRAVGLLEGRAVRIETLAGELAAEPGSGGISVDMGQPGLEWDQIPLAYAMDTLSLPVAWETLENPVAVSMGNPHAIFFVPDCDAVELDRLGPEIEHDPLFPERVNVNVAAVVSRSHIRLRVWERGAGLTLACGTGACATAVAAIRRGLTDRSVTVSLPGGDLSISWGTDNRVTMTGPATESFRGSFESADFGA